MPTLDADASFLRDYVRLTKEQRDLFRVARIKFVADIRTGSFRPGLRVKGYRRVPGAYEMTWAPDGRALFRYGDPVCEGEPHVVWLRIGTHDILDD